MERVIIVGKLYIEDNLANFLKQEGVLQEFIEESNRLNDWEGEHDVVMILIGEGFSWEKSNKGHDFWSELEHKYSTKKYLTKKY